MQLAFLGLGKMGQRMVRKLVLGGHDVIVWNRTWETTEEFVSSITYHVSRIDGEQPEENHNTEYVIHNTSQGKLTPVKEAKDIFAHLTSGPRIIWLMLPAGVATQAMIDELVSYLAPGDIIIDGGNARFSDTEKRSKELRAKSIGFLGIGVSGGVIAGVNGYPMMAGGDKDAYDHITPILDILSLPHGGHDYFGTGGAGHFVKMVHNGIEYGMMQAMGEGFDVLEKSQYDFDLRKVAHLWQKGTIVSSFLIDRAADMLDQDPKLTAFAGPVTENGEARWTVEVGKEEGVETPVIEGSLDYRLETQKDAAKQTTFTTRVLNALRNAFGGHEIPKK